VINAPRFVSALTRIWTTFYTVGLSGSLRQARRAEIESDLWDQQYFAFLQGEPRSQTASHIFLRLLLGVPSDVAWRVTAGFGAQKEGSVMIAESSTNRITLVVGIALALLPIVFGLSNIVSGLSE
jgi:hypothetical protein